MTTNQQDQAPAPVAEPSGTAQGAGVAVVDVAAALEAMAPGFEKGGARDMGLGFSAPADVAELRRLAARLRGTAAHPAPALTPPAQVEPRGVVFVLMDGAGRVLMERCPRKAGIHGGAWFIPGGRLEPVDRGSPYAALVREMREEMDCEPVASEEHSLVDCGSAGRPFLVRPYLVRDWTGTVPAHVLDHPDAPLRWFSPDEARRSPVPAVRAILALVEPPGAPADAGGEVLRGDERSRAAADDYAKQLEWLAGRAATVRALAARAREAEAWRERCERMEADVEYAAGECLVPLPEPGSDLARVCLANRQLGRQRDAAEREAADLRARCERLEAEREDSELLDYLEGLLTPGENPVEVFLAGLRQGAERASAYQCELEPAQATWPPSLTYQGPKLRDAIRAARAAEPAGEVQHG